MKRGLGADDERPSQIGLSAEKEAAPFSRYLSSAHDLQVVPMTQPSLSAVRWNDLDPSQTIPCSWSQHAEFVHAYARLCQPRKCECPFTPPAEPDVVALW